MESGNKLRARLDALNTVSATESGREWLLKALHPTDPTIGGVGMPDGTALDTVCLELTTSQTISGTFGGVPSTTPWDCKLTLLPHQVPLCVECEEPGVPGHTEGFNIRYPVLSGATPNADASKLMGLAEAWRLCAASVTVHLDANATKDSGTVVAAQQVTKPMVSFPGMATNGRINFPLIQYATQDDPDYASLMSLPRAFQANLREGLYMPLKLTNTSQHWTSAREFVLLTNPGNCPIGTVVGALLGAGTTPSFPLPAVTSPVRNLATNEISGYPVVAMMGDCFGHAAIKGIDPSSSIVVKVRHLLELKVQAASSYAPHLKPAPFPDAQAIANYFTIVRALPDAYPADHNDAGKILGVIGKAIRVVSPYLMPVPGVGKVLSQAGTYLGTGLQEVGTSVSAARKAYVAKNGKAQGKKQRRKQMASVALQVTPAVARTLATTTTRAVSAPANRT